MYSDATASLLQQLETLDPENQRELVEVGEQFGTQDVLAQLARFNEAWSSTGAIPSRYGFAADEQTEMATLANAIQNLSDVRVGKDVARSSSTDDYRDTISRGKRALHNARTVLNNVDLALRRTAGADFKDARSTIKATLERLGKAGRSKTKLKEQMTLLLTAFNHPSVVTAATGRGGPEATAEVTASLAEVGSKTAPAEKIRGNPIETRRLNLLEGYAVDLLRQGRAAARAWALDVKNPALSSAYELEFLYGTGIPRRPAPAVDPEPRPSPNGTAAPTPSNPTT